MADNVLFLGWNRARPGKERDSLEAFASGIAFLGKQLASGSIESFEPVMLDFHGGDMNGFILVRGTLPQLDGLRASDEFREVLMRADMSVNGIGVVSGHINAGLQRELGRFQKLIS